MVSCLHYACGEPDLTSEVLRESSEIKSEGNDVTEMLLVMRQKLVFSFPAVALMWFHKLTGNELCLKSDFHDLSITFHLLLL